MRNTTLKLIALASSAMTVFAVGPLMIKRGDTEASNTANCNIIQGDDLTMLTCSKSFELYITSAYAMDWHLQEDNGSADHGVILARQSDESEHPGAITFVDAKQADAPVVWRAENVDGEIVTTAIMLLNYKSKTPLTDLLVLDTLAVLRMKDGSFAFFEKPMVMGMNKTALTGIIVSENTIMPYLFNFNGYALAASPDDSNSIEFYGVLDT